ncbi:hypothetical protein SKAU_G00237450 [Synaphobranchus kaupii]|uniref:Uncharacterized protein n=1 Tax=Synaphobranchus kaupii TaxID=118154 RepID=A0A9Q1ITW5_SYNKA|nr:hypothetical protein SKAU_G00237450 [Synaphobranchus kaupii]
MEGLILGLPGRRLRLLSPARLVQTPISELISEPLPGSAPAEAATCHTGGSIIAAGAGWRWEPRPPHSPRYWA